MLKCTFCLSVLLSARQRKASLFHWHMSYTKIKVKSSKSKFWNFVLFDVKITVYFPALEWIYCHLTFRPRLQQPSSSHVWKEGDVYSILTNDSLLLGGPSQKFWLRIKTNKQTRKSMRDKGRTGQWSLWLTFRKWESLEGWLEDPNMELTGQRLTLKTTCKILPSYQRNIVETSVKDRHVYEKSTKKSVHICMLYVS